MRPDQLDPETMKDRHLRSSICTASGREFFPFAPRRADVDPDDLAHALSMKCRFTGHTAFHYSVAQHCWAASELAASRGLPRDTQRWALIHDATEAYFPDVASPIKRFLRVDDGNGMRCTFKEAEARLLSVIALRFGLPPEEPRDVKIIDAHLYQRERADVMPDAPWANTPLPPDDVPEIVQMSIECARDMWISRADFLGML